MTVETTRAVPPTTRIVPMAKALKARMGRKEKRANTARNEARTGCPWARFESESTAGST